MWDASVPDQMGPTRILHLGSLAFAHGADPRERWAHLRRQTGIPKVGKVRQKKAVAKAAQGSRNQRKAAQTAKAGERQKQRGAANAAEGSRHGQRNAAATDGSGSGKQRQRKAAKGREEPGGNA